MKTHRLFSALLPALFAAMLAAPCRGAFDNLLPSGSVWRYHYDWNGQPATVRTAAFDDSTWPQGPAQLGYGENDETTFLNPYPPNRPPTYSGDKPITAYFRRMVAAPAGNAVVLRLNLLRDDGAVIWLNGQEILRNNMPRGEITPAMTAELSMGGTDETLPVRLHVLHPPFVPGDNLFVVEIHQAASTSNDISFDLGMEVWTGPEDDDTDGLPDWWESEQFGNRTAAANEDPDRDGADNAAEYSAGTDPQNSASVFHASLSFNFAGRPLVEWQQVPGMSYRLWHSDALNTWTAGWTGTAGISRLFPRVDAAPSPSARFYRVEASRIPWP